jgi:hypothetical protein
LATGHSLFRRRPQRRDIETSRRWVWLSLDGKFCVEHRVSNYGLPEVWQVFRRPRLRPLQAWPNPDAWEPVRGGRHRSRRAAFRHAERLAREAARVEP